MSDWLETVIDKSQRIDDWLSPQRRSSAALLRQSKWPTKKTEDWKYTSLRPLENRKADPRSVASDGDIMDINGLNAVELRFVDGELEDINQALPAGLFISSFSATDASTQAWSRNLFSSCKPKKHLFGLVNDILSDNGVVIDIVEGANIETPIRIVNLLRSNTDVHHRVLVRVGAGAKVCMIEEEAGTCSSYYSGVAEYFIAENAEVEHYRFCFRTSEALSVGGAHFELQAYSKLNAFVVCFGSNLSRLDIDVMHRGSHAEANVNAIYLLDDQESLDLHTCIEHEVPRCNSEENIRGIVADCAQATFNGRIHIHRDAQKTWRN